MNTVNTVISVFFGNFGMGIMIGIRVAKIVRFSKEAGFAHVMEFHSGTRLFVNLDV